MSANAPPVESGLVSVSVSVSLDDFLSATDALYHHPDNTVKERADKWLRDFQATPEAWSICDQVLLSSSPSLSSESRFFAANTLRNKVSYTFDQLKTEHHIPFRDSLIKHCAKYATESNAIRSRLSLTLAALTVHLVGLSSWSSWLTDLSTVLGATSSINGALIFIEVVDCIASEATSPKLVIENDRRSNATKQLELCGEHVLNACFHYLSTSGSHVQLQKCVFRCFFSWTRYTPNSLSKAGTYETLFSHPIIDATFQALRIEDLVEPAIDCIEALLRLPFMVSPGDPAVRALFPRILSLSPLLDLAAASSDDDRARRVCDMFVDMGEAYLELIASGSSSGGDAMSAQSMQALEILLKCSGYPDNRISSSTFRFWYALAAYVGRCPVEVKVMKLQFLSPYYTRLVSQLRRVMEYPHDLDSWNEDLRAQSKEFRYSAAEALVDAASVVGTDKTLLIVYEALCGEVNVFRADVNKWHALESCLYCIRCIARNVPDDESTVLPKVFELLPLFASNHHLRYTATLIVGRYGTWINRHPHCLPELLGFVVQGLNDRVVAPSAALALRHICTDASKHIAAAFMPQIFSIYTNCRELAIEEQREITAAICATISCLERSKFEEALGQLILPMANELHQALTTINTQPETKENVGTSVHLYLDRISEIIKQLDPELNDDEGVIKAGVASIFNKIWSLLQLALNHYKNDERKMEKLTRCWKYCIKTMGSDFLPVIGSFVSTILSTFSECPLPPFIYIMSTCCDKLGSIPSVEPLFLQCVVTFNARCVDLFMSEEAMIHYPELMEDYYSFLLTVVRKCPNVLFNANSSLDRIFQTCIVGLHVPHTPSVSALYAFLEELIQACTDSPRANAQRKPPGPPNPIARNGLLSLLSVSGNLLVVKLMEGVNGAVSSSKCMNISHIMSALIDAVGNALKPVVEHAIQSFAETNLPSKSEFVRDLFDSNHPTSINDAIETFYAACRNRPKIAT